MLAAALLASALAFTPEDAKFAINRARELVEQCTPRDAGTIRGKIAANYILDEASAAGADVRRDLFRAMTPYGEREFVNLYAEFRNGDADSRWVVLVSHYDTKAGMKCPGANDGASTTGLLIAFANAVSSWSGAHGNLLLVWTDGEECIDHYSTNDGLWGSKRAVEYLREHNYKTQAVICLDMLGDRDLSISLPANVTPKLASIVHHAARRSGHEGLVHDIPELVKDDHLPFLEKGLPSVVLIDFCYGPENSFWHSPRDTIENISEESLLKSGRIVAEMLNILL